MILSKGMVSGRTSPMVGFEIKTLGSLYCVPPREPRRLEEPLERELEPELRLTLPLDRELDPLLRLTLPLDRELDPLLRRALLPLERELEPLLRLTVPRLDERLLDERVLVPRLDDRLDDERVLVPRLDDRLELRLTPRLLEERELLRLTPRLLDERELLRLTPRLLDERDVLRVTPRLLEDRVVLRVTPRLLLPERVEPRVTAEPDRVEPLDREPNVERDVPLVRASSLRTVPRVERVVLRLPLEAPSDRTMDRVPVKPDSSRPPRVMPRVPRGLDVSPPRPMVAPRGRYVPRVPASVTPPTV
ncbi:MAG: hypothetical protein JJ896_12000 [Rhodothermales bacterium]|nr:hypothetical protein [Rhodothermales bacterium]MBO6780366.1 hypothetical protein [Rhodothermales bacterium]